MNIAMYCSSSSWGGLEMNFVKRAIWLSQHGASIFMYGIDGSNFITEGPQDNTRIVLKQKKTFPISAAIRLIKELKKDKINLLVVRDNRDLPLAAWVSFLSGRKIKTAYIQAMKLSKKKKDLIHTIRYHYIDLWIATLPYLKKQVSEFVSINQDKIHVVRLGLDTERFKAIKPKSECRQLLNLPTDKVIIGLAGRLDEQKGQLTLLKAFNRLEDRFGLHLVLLGDKTKDEADDYAASIEQFIIENDLSDDISILPFMQKVELFYNAIDIFVMASRAETYGMVTVEAMMSGLSIIGSEAGGTPELLENGKYGRLFIPDNDIDLAKMLSAVIDEGRTIGFKREGVQLHAEENYSKESECKRLMEIFGAVVNSRN